MVMFMKRACRALYGIFNTGNYRFDVQVIIDENPSFTHISTGVRWNNPDFGVQLRSYFHQGRASGCSFKFEVDPTSMFVRKPVGKPLVVSSRTSGFVQLKNGPWVLPLSFLIVLISTVRLAYRHVNGDYCGITMPLISPSNPYRNKLAQARGRGKVCLWYFLPTQYMGQKFKNNFLDRCGESIVPGFKDLVNDEKQVEKVFLFSDFREYQQIFSICLTISLGLLSVVVITPFVRVITTVTLNTVLKKPVAQSYFLQLILIQYSIAVTKVIVDASGWVVFIPLISLIELLFWIQSMASLNLKWVQNQMKKTRQLK